MGPSDIPGVMGCPIPDRDTKWLDRDTKWLDRDTEWLVAACNELRALPVDELSEITRQTYRSLHNINHQLNNTVDAIDVGEVPDAIDVGAMPDAVLESLRDTLPHVVALLNPNLSNAEDFNVQLLAIHTIINLANIEALVPHLIQAGVVPALVSLLNERREWCIAATWALSNVARDIVPRGPHTIVASVFLANMRAIFHLACQTQWHPKRIHRLGDTLEINVPGVRVHGSATMWFDEELDNYWLLILKCNGKYAWVRVTPGEEYVHAELDSRRRLDDAISEAAQHAIDVYSKNPVRMPR